MDERKLRCFLGFSFSIFFLIVEAMNEGKDEKMNEPRTSAEDKRNPKPFCPLIFFMILRINQSEVNHAERKSIKTTNHRTRHRLSPPIHPSPMISPIFLFNPETATVGKKTSAELPDSIGLGLS